MNSVILDRVGKKFNNEWIFQNVSLHLNQGDCLAITGGNGSGKSTLMQMFSGYVSPSTGKLRWLTGGNDIASEEVYKSLSVCSPSLQLIEEFTLEELISLYFNFKPIFNNFSITQILSLSGLESHKSKFIKDFSSGMKQRVKLLLAFATSSSLLLLDEPCSNLDRAAIAWYKENLLQFSTNRIIIVCSNNIDDELFLCNKSIIMEHFKIRL